MRNACLAEKPRLGQKIGDRRIRRRKSLVSPSGVGQKWPSLRRGASGSHVDYNARLYDPKLGRFLSTDPLIAHPGSTQSINPYSYVENNPLNKTDPTGMASTPTCTGSGSNRVCTGSVTTTPTGSHIPQTTTVSAHASGKVTTSGPGSMPGGRIAMSVDGNSSLSFSSAGMIAKNSTGKIDVNRHNFDAQSTGMVQKHRGTDSANPMPANLSADQKNKLNSTIGKVNKLLLKRAKKGGWKSEKELAIFLHKHLGNISINLNVEIGATIYYLPLMHSYTVFAVRTDDPPMSNTVGVPGDRRGFTRVADWHTHGGDPFRNGGTFSSRDLKGNIDHFLSTPSGALMYFDYARYVERVNRGGIMSSYEGKLSTVTEVPL